VVFCFLLFQLVLLGYAFYLELFTDICFIDKQFSLGYFMLPALSVALKTELFDDVFELRLELLGFD
jgi:hypothetical protein